MDQFTPFEAVPCCDHPDILHCKLGGDSGAPTGDYCLSCGCNQIDHAVMLTPPLQTALVALAQKMRGHVRHGEAGD